MNKHILRSLIATAALSAGLAGPALADQVWDFGALFTNAQTNTNLGSSVTFTQTPGTWLTATAVVEPAWTQSGCTGAGTSGEPCLFAKVSSGDPTETGLGLTPANENEIGFNEGIALQANPNNPILSVTLGSIQSTESWAVAGCNATFTSCMKVDSGVGGTANTVTVNLSADDFASYVVYVPCDIGSTCDSTTVGGADNILLMAASTSVPEPGALALFGAGLLGCALFIGRRRRAHTQA